MPLEKKTFLGGLNKDDANEIVPDGDYIDANNVFVSTVGNTGLVTNSKGQTLVSFSLPTGVNKCVGTYEDRPSATLYYLIYNDLSDHGLYRWDGINIVLILQTQFLGLQGDTVTGLAKLGNILFFTDPFANEPIQIDVVEARAFTVGLTSSYVSPLIQEYFTLIKQPPLSPPVCVYGTDTNSKTNYLKSKLFQFKTRYCFFEKEKSVTSMISDVPYPTHNCASGELANNFISINFETGVSTCTKIELYFREGNTGDFYLIDTFVKSELSIPSNSTYTYSWYNDGIYNAGEINEMIQLFDDVPQNVTALDVIPGNRLALANGIHQFDNVPVDGVISVSYEAEQNIETFSVSGKIYIRNPYSLVDNSFRDFQPIHYPTGSVYNGQPSAVFGGFGATALGANGSNAGTTYDQYLPLGGFVPYLAGTPLFAVSQQNVPSEITNVMPGFPGVYVNDGSPVAPSSNISHIRDAINDGGNVYSTFTINNIPKGGKYILRVAGHRTTANDLADPQLGYQKTSTYVFDVGGTEGYEIVVDENTPSGIIIQILDTIDVQIGFQSIVSDGYLVCDDGTGMDVRNMPRIELARININENPIAFWAISAILLTATAGFLAWIAAVNLFAQVLGYNSIKHDNPTLQGWGSGKMRTDHNGFFFYSMPTFLATVSKLRIAAYTVPSGLAQARFIKNFGDSTVYDVNGVNIGNDLNDTGATTHYYIKDNNANIGLYARTEVTGQITDGSTGVQGVIVMSTRTGLTTTTNASGNFGLSVFGDLSNNNPSYDGGLPNANNRADTLVFWFNGQCNASVTPSFINYNVPIFSNTGNYNKALPYPVGTTPILTFGTDTSVSFKHGGVYQIGVVYEDNYGRLGNTNTSANLKLSIPFQTAVGGNFGKPTVTVTITTPPPSWARKMILVRTLNTAMNSYVQFLINSVQYVDDNNNPVPAASATQIIIDLWNIDGTQSGSFVNRFAGSILTPGMFTRGQRIRFLQDSAGNNLATGGGQYYDIEVQGGNYSGGATQQTIGFVIPNSLPSSIILQGGELIELYVPKLQVKEQLFYEMAISVEATASQNVPITLHGGDTYYRFRNMPYYQGAFAAYPNPNSLRKTLIEDVSYSDFVSLPVQNIGRPNKIDKNVTRIHRPTVVWYSLPYIFDTQVNGLNTFRLLNWAEYPQFNGAITYIYSGLAVSGLSGNRIDVYQTLRVGSVLVNEASVVTQTGSSVVGQTTKVLNDIIYYQGERGCSNPESIKTYSFRRYWWDAISGAVCRLSTDGIFPISDYKMYSYFAEKAKYFKSGLKAFGWYDIDNATYGISFIGGGTTERVRVSGGGGGVDNTPYGVKNGEFDAPFVPGNGWEEGFSTEGTFSIAVGGAGQGVFSQTQAGSLTIFGTTDLPINSGQNYPVEIDIEYLDPLANEIYVNLGDTATSGTPVLVALQGTTSINVIASGTTPLLWLTSVNISGLTSIVTINYIRIPSLNNPSVDPTDPVYKDVFIPLPPETITFSEDKNRWASFWGFHPEMFGSLGMGIVLFQDGQLWTSESNPIHGNFLGVQCDADITVVSNLQPSDEKKYLSISEEASELWEIPTILTPPSDSAINGQETEVLDLDFTEKEGIFYAPLNKNKLTPNVVNPIFEGDIMAGSTATFQLRNSLTKFVKLFCFNINWITSNRSNR